MFRTYWDWNKRTRETDRRWLAYQCSKEIWGSGLAPLDKGIVLGPAEALVAGFSKVDIELDRHDVLDLAEGLHAEFAHYCAFADVHDALGLADEPKLNPKSARIVWPEDRALAELRLAHKARHPKLGARATSFTEGGYCTLFSEGMKLVSRTNGPHGRANALIAAACAKVYEDEFGHMLKGIVGLDDEEPSPDEWQTLEELSVAQLRARILMRNSQFSYVIGEPRLSALIAGACEPIAFDYEKARLEFAGAPVLVD
ncbi:hypothetical protein A5736_00145 [Mycobacterium sp. SP-6446]|nr:hypothetical protein A5736_00145 [Mycobacterium sp. SP-6446]